MNVSESELDKCVEFFLRHEFDEELYLRKNRDLRQFEGNIRTIVHHLISHGFEEGRTVSFKQTEAIKSNLEKLEIDQAVKKLFLARLDPSVIDYSLSFSQIDHESPLPLLRRKHGAAHWLAPVDLTITETKLNRVLIVGSCFAESWDFDKRNLSNCPVDVVLANNVAQLGDIPHEASSYDFQVVQIAFRSIFPDHALTALQYADLEGHQKVFDRVCARLALQLKSLLEWNTRHGILTFVTNFLVPQQNPLGRLMPRYDLRNPAYFVEQVNAVLESYLRDYQNVYFLDIDKIAASIGRMYVQDDSITLFSHSALLFEGGVDESRIERMAAAFEHFDVKSRSTYADALWIEMLAMYRTVRQLDPVKLVVVDLDDTLWKGVSGEDRDVDPIMIEGWPLGIAEALCYLKKRGVLLAIVSKNDSDRIHAIWDKIFRGRLKLDDFAVKKINWAPKAENMRELLAEVNLLPRNTVFIDDNPVERAAMKFAFPDMRILGKYPYYLRRILLWAPETQVASISDESARRTEMIQAQSHREQQRKELSREDFLATLELKVRLFSITATDNLKFARAFELLNKTNQFNTTGRRWKHEECAAAFAHGTVFYAFEVDDRFSAYGLVGVVIVEANTIVQFVMSCRVVGLEVEKAVLAKILPLIRANGFHEVTASFVETDANLLCRDLYQKVGFTLQDGKLILADEYSEAHTGFISVLNDIGVHR